MEDFGINEMLEMQRELQKRYADIWEGISPQVGKNKLLWMVGEIGEVIDIVKKHDADQLCQEEPTRRQLVEELADVLMYYSDVLLCYGISAEELRQTYAEKHIRNMARWEVPQRKETES